MNYNQISVDLNPCHGYCVLALILKESVCQEVLNLIQEIRFIVSLWFPLELKYTFLCVVFTAYQSVRLIIMEQK